MTQVAARGSAQMSKRARAAMRKAGIAVMSGQDCRALVRSDTQQTSSLVQYEAARRALAECAKVDEAKDIRDKAAALAAYARQRDDKDMETWLSEIRLRACIRIGELSRELDTERERGAAGRLLPTSGKQDKRQTLADAGIGTSTAHRYEELAGGREEQGQIIGLAAAEKYFAQTRAENEPATMNGLRQAVRGALREAFGEPPRKNQAPPEAPEEDDHRYIEWVGGLRALALAENFDPDYLARRARDFPTLLDADREWSVTAMQRINQFLQALEAEYVEAE